MCVTLGVTRSSYYEWKTKHRNVQKQTNLREQIGRIFEDSKQRYGSPRVQQQLRTLGQRVSRKRVAQIMKAAGLKVRQKRRYQPCTTESNHAYPVAPNLLPDTTVQKPNQVWLTDITYIKTGEGWLYLAGVLDRASRYLVGWAMDSNLQTALPMAALTMALKNRHLKTPLIHHSDRGIQYASTAYRDLLNQHGLTASMSRKGNCYDNAAMESFWSTLKRELVYRCRFQTRAQARLAIFEYIESFYNRVRLHSSLGYKSPLDYESSVT